MGLLVVRILSISRMPAEILPPGLSMRITNPVAPAVDQRSSQSIRSEV